MSFFEYTPGGQDCGSWVIRSVCVPLSAVRVITSICAGFIFDAQKCLLAVFFINSSLEHFLFFIYRNWRFLIFISSSDTNYEFWRADVG